MDKQRVLREAQKIAAKFSFWMVSGNITHLYGYVYETPEKKYELEIKFGENFPDKAPKFLLHDETKELLGDVQLDKLRNWSPESSIVDIVQELKEKIQDALQVPKNKEEQEIASITDVPKKKANLEIKKGQKLEDIEISPEPEEYLTPDLNAYPPDFEFDEYLNPSSSEEDFFYDKESKETSFETETFYPSETSKDELEKPPQEQSLEEFEETSVAINTELGLIQQEYAYDQIGKNMAEINIYITITLTKTFIIRLDFSDYPKKPTISIPDELKKIIGDPYQSIETLKNWNIKAPFHIVEILHEIEKKLYFLKEIEIQSKKILGEYQCDKIPESITKLKVHLLTYGFKEHTLDIDLATYPNPPTIGLTPELKNIIRIPIIELNSYKNWKENESEPVEIVREISWLLDKNSRISFEIDLLKEHYQNINYNPLTATLSMEMKGKMKTQDITFQFQIKLPTEYPSKMPEVKVVNEFELDSHAKIRDDLHSSFDDFFDEWTPFSYLIDLFNLISKKIFEVSVVSCVICHKIDCPTCSVKIATSGDIKPCYTACPYCERTYHNHCWEQTIKSFGKCGFCLKTPPPHMIP